MFKVNNKDTRTPLTFRIFDSIRHHSSSSAFKNMCFWKGRRCCWKNVTKSRTCSKCYNLTKKWFNSTEISNHSSMFIFLHIKFFYSNNNTAKNSKTKCYKELHLADVVAVLVLMQPTFFLREGHKSDIMDFLFYHEL